MREITCAIAALRIYHNNHNILMYRARFLGAWTEACRSKAISGLSLGGSGLLEAASGRKRPAPALKESDVVALRLKQCLEVDWTSKLTLEQMKLGHSRLFDPTETASPHTSGAYPNPRSVCYPQEHVFEARSCVAISKAEP